MVDRAQPVQDLQGACQDEAKFPAEAKRHTGKKRPAGEELVAGARGLERDRAPRGSAEAARADFRRQPGVVDPAGLQRRLGR